ncbi:MAG: CTP synthase [Oscillospiraceae bacterium]|jgi:CTP synthase|nr:CTP synthase [Oscillospiraceae bacterium]
MAKYIFVTGGVVSGLGKGICASSLGRLLKQRGLRVTLQKLDPYFNIDPGTMNPIQHGEVFVTDDGAETDLDIGHYERFIDENLTANSSVSSGKVYWSVLNSERDGEFLGKTVQIIPHITDKIKSCIYSLDDGENDVIITEIGGTVGDIESQPYLEAIRQVGKERGAGNVLYIHVSLIVQIPGSNELKTKPTQHSVKELLSMGITPDILVCRTAEPLPDGLKRKIALFCNTETDCVIQNITARSLYEVPLLMAQEGLDLVACRKLGLVTDEPDLTEWHIIVDRTLKATKIVKIALVGKYTELHDAYLSIAESFYHAGTENDVIVDIDWIDSETLTDENAGEILKTAQGIIVPGGFGERGIEGMISAVKYARENDIPYFGICLGMQMAVIEFARHVAGLTGAHTTEVDPGTKYPVIDLMPEQVGITQKGGTMRLGKYPCVLSADSVAINAYGQADISERHRHRLEFNNEYREILQAKGLLLSGLSPSGNLVEIVELPTNKFFVGVQFHPEFKSRPNRAHPLFREFVKASIR